jgi:hypothetical protein
MAMLSGDYPASMLVSKRNAAAICATLCRFSHLLKQAFEGSGGNIMKIVEISEVAPTCHSNFKLVETAEVSPTCHSNFKLVESTEVAPTCH